MFPLVPPLSLSCFLRYFTHIIYKLCFKIPQNQMAFKEHTGVRRVSANLAIGQKHFLAKIGHCNLTCSFHTVCAKSSSHFVKDVLRLHLPGATVVPTYYFCKPSDSGEIWEQNL